MNAHTESRWAKVMPGMTREAESEVRHRLAREGHFLTQAGEAILRDTAEFFATHICGDHLRGDRIRMTWQPKDVDRLHCCMLDNIRY